MKFLYDLFPVLLFFLIYKLYGEIPAVFIDTANTVLPRTLTPGKASDAIFLATAVAIVASFAQVSVHWLRHHRFEKMHLVSLALITVFGGATLILQDPVFIKWKPTILNWLFAAVFLISHWVGNKTLAERMMSHAITVPEAVWQRVNLGWIGFFLFAGATNLYVAYTFSEEIWVDFKLFGLMGMTLVFVIVQAFYLARYMEDEVNEKS